MKKFTRRSDANHRDTARKLKGPARVRRGLVLFAVAVFLCGFAPLKQTLEHCGLGGHACNCAAHVQKIQQAYVESCRKTAQDPKALEDCLKGMPSHCSLVDHYSESDPETGEPVAIPMSERCSMACKKSHCTCSANEEVCHLGHTIEDDVRDAHGTGGRSPSSQDRSH